MKRAIALIILLAGICCGAFASDPLMPDLNTRVVYDPSARFPSSGVFDFVYETPSLPHDPELNKVDLESRQRQAVIETLEAKGYVFRGNLKAEPVFRVRIGASLEGAANLPVTAEGSTTSPEWLAGVSNSPEFKQAVTVVDIIDQESDRMIWRGVAEARLLFNEKVSEEKKTLRTGAMIHQILAEFPPAP